MNRVPGSLLPLALLRSAVLAACAAFLLLGARPIDAGPGAPRRHASLSGDVQVDGDLAREGAGWVIRLRAANPGGAAQRCSVKASLTSLRFNPMARALPRPQVLWSSAVALLLPAGGESARTLPVPDEMAARIREPEPPGKDDPAALMTVTETFGVALDARCAAEPDGDVG